MIYYLIALISTFLVAYLIIRYQNIHAHLTGDIHNSGPQKIHTKVIPRIGGLAIMIGVAGSLLIRYAGANFSVYILFILSTSLFFALGLVEDITKSVSVKTRLLVTGLCAIIAINILNIEIHTVDIPIIDHFLKFPIIATAFSIFAIVGLTNAYNIIDGLNGLSSMVACISAIGIAYLSYISGDTFTLTLSLTLVSAILGFFPWNFPRGAIFLGDSGAYLLGFAISALSILLIKNNSLISPWFAVLINIYPIVETLFSIYRRKFHRGFGPGQPDALHLHSLFYRRILLRGEKNTISKEINLRNSATSPYLWALCLFGTIPALIFYKNTYVLMLLSLIFLMLYIFLYIRVIKFRTPRWLKNNIY